jgi:hypothetical protein
VAKKCTGEARKGDEKMVSEGRDMVGDQRSWNPRKSTLQKNQRKRVPKMVGKRGTGGILSTPGNLWREKNQRMG